MVRRVAIAWALALAVAASARAQSGSSGTSTGQSTTVTQTPSSSTATAEETRPATTTFFGDTGLWYVPTGEVLGSGKWSVSGYRRGTNWIEGYTNVADFAGTLGFGIRDRAEIFGSFLVDTRIDRDVRPLFLANPTFGGVIDRYPRVNQYWTGDHVGVAALREDPTLRVTIEGHTCNIGTAEYNLALGERRANAVRDYLVSRGVAADRLRTVSYGEERPKYDNSREETRRLNRRAALMVNLER